MCDSCDFKQFIRTRDMDPCQFPNNRTHTTMLTQNLRSSVGLWARLTASSYLYRGNPQDAHLDCNTLTHTITLTLTHAHT